MLCYNHKCKLFTWSLPCLNSTHIFGLSLNALSLGGPFWPLKDSYLLWCVIRLLPGSSP